MTDKSKPLVYACSGCSNLAEMAHSIAVNLDNDGIAQASCISGVMGNVDPIKKLAHSGRTIFAIDGCSLGCIKSCLDECGLTPKHYFNLNQLGFEKRAISEESLRENVIAMNQIYDELLKSGYTFPKNI